MQNLTTITKTDKENMESGMSKYKVISGEFQVIVHEATFGRAGDLAIKIHHESNSPFALGTLTLVEKLDQDSKSTDDMAFFGTETLISNRAEIGNGIGQYSIPKQG